MADRHEDETRAYCPTCRVHVKPDTPGEWLPPYSVIHVSPTEHLHPTTREPVEVEAATDETGSNQ